MTKWDSLRRIDRFLWTVLAILGGSATAASMAEYFSSPAIWNCPICKHPLVHNQSRCLKCLSEFAWPKVGT